MNDDRALMDGCWSVRGRDGSTRYAVWLGIGFVLNVLSGIPVLGWLFFVPAVWLLWTALVRRGHDMGRSAWFTFGISCLPSLTAVVLAGAAMVCILIGSTIGFVALLCASGIAFLASFAASLWYLCANGDAGDNEWGPDPRTSEAIAADPHRVSDAKVGRIVAAVAVGFTILTGVGLVLFVLLVAGLG